MLCLGPEELTRELTASNERSGATEPGLEGGVYVGPGGLGEFRGHPRVVSPARQARDEHEAARLWSVAEELTGVRFELGGRAATP